MSYMGLLGQGSNILFMCSYSTGDEKESVKICACEGVCSRSSVSWSLPILHLTKCHLQVFKYWNNINVNMLNTVGAVDDGWIMWIMLNIFGGLLNLSSYMLDPCLIHSKSNQLNTFSFSFSFSFNSLDPIITFNLFRGSNNSRTIYHFSGQLLQRLQRPGLMPRLSFTGSGVALCCATMWPTLWSRGHAECSSSNRTAERTPLPLAGSGVPSVPTGESCTSSWAMCMRWLI